MSVARDAITEAGATFTTGTTISHTPVGTPKGVLLWIAQNGSATDETPAATYGGVSMDVIAFAADTATEPMAAYLLFLGSGIPTGTQNCVISSMAGATKIAWVETLTAAADTEIADSGVAQEDQADPSVALTTGASQETYVASLLMSGAGTQGAITAPTSPAGTKQQNFDFGQQVAVLGDLDAVDAGGGVTFTWTMGSDDTAMVAAAVAEVAGGGATVTGAASLTTTVGITAAGTRVALGAASLEVTATVAAQGTRTTFGAVAETYTVGITATAASGANTVTGAASLSLVAGIAATGVRTRFGAASQETTLTVAATGVRTRFGAAASTYTVTIGAAGTRTRLGAVSLEVTFGGAVTAAAGHAVGAVSFEVTVGIGARAIRGKSILLVPTNDSTLTLDPKEPGVLP